MTSRFSNGMNACSGPSFGIRQCRPFDLPVPRASTNTRSRSLQRRIVRGPLRSAARGAFAGSAEQDEQRIGLAILAGGLQHDDVQIDRAAGLGFAVLPHGVRPALRGLFQLRVLAGLELQVSRCGPCVAGEQEGEGDDDRLHDAQLPCRTNSPAKISMASHRFCRRRFSFAACWLLS